MASGNVNRTKKAEHMAAPTSAARVKKVLPTRSRPHMARICRLPRCSKWAGIWGTRAINQCSRHSPRPSRLSPSPPMDRHSPMMIVEQSAVSGMRRQRCMLTRRSGKTANEPVLKLPATGRIPRLPFHPRHCCLASVAKPSVDCSLLHTTGCAEKRPGRQDPGKPLGCRRTYAPKRGSGMPATPRL